MNAKQQAAAFSREFAKAGDPARAEKERAYLKTDHRFHGVAIPFIRAAAKRFYKEHKALTREELKALVDELFESSFHDQWSLAIALLELYAKLLRAEDLRWIESLLRNCSTWDHIDWLSTRVAGAIVSTNPTEKKTLRRWARDDNFWIRRASLLALHDDLRAGEGDFDLFEELAVPMLPEKEFFIRKAIGWVLRATVAKRPELVRAFVDRHQEEMSGLTLREATRKL